jgi:L-alanine-DL-glutamate epimerase-like enolase superfamily enzyme
MRAEGFRALKIRVDPRRLEEGLAAVRATRDAVGDTMAIMVDLNQGWRMAGDVTPPIELTTARSIATRLAELDVLWLEEPLDGGDLAGLAALRAAVPGIRIAGGEMTRTYRELEAALDADAFDVHQPDVVLAAGVGGGPFLEFPYDPPGWTPERRDAFLAAPIRPDADGVLRVPAEPGLGIELDDLAVRRYAA